MGRVPSRSAPPLLSALQSWYFVCLIAPKYGFAGAYRVARPEKTARDFGPYGRPSFSTDCGGFLAVAAVDPTLRRDGVFDLALPFLGAVLSRIRDFAMEIVDIALGSFGSRRRN
jgi:hypothetical protein